MPVGPTNTKAQKQKVVHTEMHKFKEGDLHSGSKGGPKVTNRKQAVAIALSESGQSKKSKKTPAVPPAKGSAPPMGQGESKPNYDRSAHFKGNPGFAESHSEPNQNYHDEQAEHWGPRLANGPQVRHQGAPKRVGHLRMSGHPSAHRIGARKR